tara:strand:- start:704 stop:1279 length:576 start_codon:yes stop_codon:yes gene_type:complete
LISKIKKIIVNHLLSQNDWMQSKLIAHKNKTITISISNFEIHFEIKNNGQLKTIDKKKKVDCIIKLSINDFISQIINNNKGKISIEGDLELAKEVSEILKQIEWDIEEDLSKYIGDIPAIHTTRLIKKILHTGKNNINNLTGSLLEYWEEENKILAKKNHVSKFNYEVDQIVEDVDRLEAKINMIINKIKS